MTEPYRACLDWIDTQQQAMARLVADLAAINSGSLNLDGLDRVAGELQRQFSSLGAPIEAVCINPLLTIDAAGNERQTPLGRALVIRKRPEARRRVLLVIHYDTVYSADDPFQNVSGDGENLRGPGVADAKGGICVMLFALRALERSEFASRLGWEVILNPDEELGSIGSAPLLTEAARRNHLGLVYEPALADGTLIGARKGSGNFTAVVRGRAAHAGRDFHLGRNAIHAAGALVVAIDELNRTIPRATFNVAKIDGGGPSNIVPDVAVVRFNVRVEDREDQYAVLEALRRIVARTGERDGIDLRLHGGFTSPLKPMDAMTTGLYGQVAASGAEIGLDLRWQDSGGASDANKLQAAGLPVIDTMGPRGGQLHSPGEFMVLASLAEKAKLSALVLMKLAGGDFALPEAGQQPKTP